ncbi:hypothetical protein NPIL_69241 [Nephila pilipes]|uniref:Uncharacterized protein n=1 Tax=Nephila pilipes TaxID=299642 RepID=A0A8X6QBM8_NEPPI|nr:hypothetical protein NPIL_69241 [Nephila pilipes]
MTDSGRIVLSFCGRSQNVHVDIPLLLMGKSMGQLFALPAPLPGDLGQQQAANYLTVPIFFPNYHKALGSHGTQRENSNKGRNFPEWQWPPSENGSLRGRQMERSKSVLRTQKDCQDIPRRWGSILGIMRSQVFWPVSVFFLPFFQKA